jgi:haloacetate dehalogenase
MTVFCQDVLAPRIASGSVFARRSFLESCLGLIVGGMTMQDGSVLAQALQTSPIEFFPGFRRQTIQTSGTTINVVIGGGGPPVLLLHGYPQTHVEWRKISS